LILGLLCRKPPQALAEAALNHSYRQTAAGCMPQAAAGASRGGVKSFLSANSCGPPQVVSFCAAAKSG